MGGLSDVGGKMEGTAEESMYLLVGATVEFLREFVIDDKEEEENGVKDKTSMKK